MKLKLVSLIVLLLCYGCTQQQTQNLSQGLLSLSNNIATNNRIPVSSNSIYEAVLVYSQETPRVFLGCLNCNELDSNSIKNEFGNYGSEFSAISMRNTFSNYGSEFSNVSPCNEFASSPPFAVTKSGKYLGIFSISEFKSKEPLLSSARRVCAR